MSRSTPFVAFWPHVTQKKAQRDKLRNAIERLPLGSWPAKPPRVSAEAQRDVLGTIASFTDASGRALLNVETIVRESGYSESVVVRTFRAFETYGHLERIKLRRLPKYYTAELQRLARQGQGPNLYRIGAALRSRAGLLEDDWVPDPDLVLETSVTPPTGDPVTSPTKDAAVTPPGGTPYETHEVPGEKGVSRETTVTPQERKNGSAAGEEVRLVPSRSEETAEATNTVEVEGSCAGAQAHTREGQPVYCPNHSKNTSVETVTAGLVYFACGCFAHEADWQGTAA